MHLLAQPRHPASAEPCHRRELAGRLKARNVCKAVRNAIDGFQFLGDRYRDGGMKLRSMLSGDGMNLRSSPGAIAVTGLTVMRGALGGPDAS